GGLYAGSTAARRSSCAMSCISDSGLAASPLCEMHDIAEELRRAAVEPAYNPRAAAIEPELEAFLAGHGTEDDEAFGQKVRDAAMVGASAAPTLVRYTEPSSYPRDTYDAVAAAIREPFGDEKADGARGVELSSPADPSLEMAAT